MAAVKTCPGCGRTLPVTAEHFGADRSSKSGFAGQCKPCAAARARAWRDSNLAADLAYKAAWREANRDKYNAYQAKYRAENLDVIRTKEREFGRANPEVTRERRLKSRYVLTLTEFDERSRAQDGRCAICRKPPKAQLCVDHAHSTRKVRGLLCRSCNLGIGYLQESPAILTAAAAYIKHWHNEPIDE